MRISTEESDPGFAKFVEWGQPYGTKVFFNGESIKDCLTADEETGEVLVLARDDDGMVIQNKVAGCLQTQWLRGNVRIEMPNRCKSCGRRTHPESAGDDLDCGGDCWACVNTAEQP